MNSSGIKLNRNQRRALLRQQYNNAIFNQAAQNRFFTPIPQTAPMQTALSNTLQNSIKLVNAGGQETVTGKTPTKFNQGTSKVNASTAGTSTNQAIQQKPQGKQKAKQQKLQQQGGKNKKKQKKSQFQHLKWIKSNPTQQLPNVPKGDKVPVKTPIPTIVGQGPGKKALGTVNLPNAISQKFSQIEGNLPIFPESNLDLTGQHIQQVPRKAVVPVKPAIPQNPGGKKNYNPQKGFVPVNTPAGPQKPADVNTKETKPISQPMPVASKTPETPVTKSVTVNKPTTPVKTPPGAEFKGRMTAASFMKLQAPISASAFGFPKGIPKSFLANRANGNAPNETFQNPPNQAGSAIRQRLPASPAYAAKFVHTPGAGWVPINEQFYDDVDIEPSPQQLQGQGYVQAPGPNYQQFDQNQGGASKTELQMKPGELHVKIDDQSTYDYPQQYSPSDAYNDIIEGNEDISDKSKSPDSGSKRLSAFQRLGPLSEPKKPKLTINLLCSKEDSVREVVDASDEEDSKFTPVHLRADIQTSTDETVMKYLAFWPWKKNLAPPRRIVSARHNKSMMLIEQEQMEEAYDRDNAFFQISITGYPPSWSKEDVLDTLLENVKGKSLIPCFVEYLKEKCQFLVIRSRPSLSAIHNLGFIIHNEAVELRLSIAQMLLSTNQIEFIPRLVLRKRLVMALENEYELNLSEFTTKSDISHFIYFPLNRVANQSELVHIQSSVPWQLLTKLNLSHNRMTSITGFNLQHMMPKLKHLDLSYNYLDSLRPLLQCRTLPLNAIVLEGNPLCTDYIEQDSYIKVLKLMFPALKEIDGIKLKLPEDFPEYKKHFCPDDAHAVVDKLLELMFPLLDASPDERNMIENMYDVNAMMTITFAYKLRYSELYKDYRSTLFNHARLLEENILDIVFGADCIAKLIYKWPTLMHDPTTFNVDVMYHTNTTTIVRISGILKVTTSSLAEEEHILSFTRTLVLNSIDGYEYKITNEMVYWELPDKDMARKAFRITSVRSKNVNLTFETSPDEEIKRQLVEVFMKLTELDRKPSYRCLEMKNWNFRDALDYFSKLLKLDHLEPLLGKE